jgi:hypothetical protein
MEKILLVKKISAWEYYYNKEGKNQEDLLPIHKQQEKTLKIIEKLVKDSKIPYKIVTRKELSKNLINNCDFLISGGGDGTVIASAFYNKNIPQLNLRLDKSSKGHLCYKNIETALKKVLQGDYDIQKWTRQDVYLDKKFIGRALNETCVGENGLNFSKMTRYELNSEFQKNSGLIIATGTGSTGWPSEFIKYPRDSKLFKFSALSPNEGSSFGEANYIKIKYKGHKGQVVMDASDIMHDLPRNSTLEIKLSENPLKVVVVK